MGNVAVSEVILDALDILRKEIPHHSDETINAKTLLFVAVRELFEKYDETNAQRVYNELKEYTRTRNSTSLSEFIEYYRKKYFKIVPLQ
jgi:uncharacterized protein YqgV (UPF0045/DUF77 family)